MNKIFLTVTVGPDYTLLPEFLKYYKRLGITNFLVILNTSDPAVGLILQQHEIHSVHSWFEPFSEQAKQSHERFTVLRYCSIDDWILYADLDEFQLYPKGLFNHISHCEKNGIEFLEGRLIDRVSEDGTLVTIDNKINLCEQFPLRGYITSKLLKAWDKKIVLARGKWIVGGGHHVFLDSNTKKPLPYKSELNEHSYGIEVHHFKWDSKLLPRMNGYLELQDESLFFWKKEIKRFMKHYEKHSRIRVEDKRFKFTYC